jgi:SAM-dependent methyltransferase
VIVDAACAIGGLEPGSRVVEVGSGTGKLTRSLAARRLEIDAVDPGAELIHVNRRNLPDGAVVHFHHGRFEDVELPERTFRAVFSATAFHWVDPDVGWAKTAELLQPGGILALLTHVPATTKGSRGLEEAFRDALISVMPDITPWELRTEDEIRAGLEARRGNISALWAWLQHRDMARPVAADLFTDVGFEYVASEVEETVEEFLALLRTSSAYLSLEPVGQALLEQRVADSVKAYGGTSRGTSLAMLVTARVAR